LWKFESTRGYRGRPLVTHAYHVLFGKDSGWSPQFNLTTLNGNNGFVIEGLNANDFLGFILTWQDLGTISLHQLGVGHFVK